VQITQAADYDLAGEVVALDDTAHASEARVSLRVLPSDNRIVR